MISCVWIPGSIFKVRMYTQGNRNNILLCSSTNYVWQNTLIHHRKEALSFSCSEKHVSLGRTWTNNSDSPLSQRENDKHIFPKIGKKNITFFGQCLGSEDWISSQYSRKEISRVKVQLKSSGNELLSSIFYILLEFKTFSYTCKILWIYLEFKTFFYASKILWISQVGFWVYVCMTARNLGREPFLCLFSMTAPQEVANF